MGELAVFEQECLLSVDAFVPLELVLEGLLKEDGEGLAYSLMKIQQGTES